MEAQKKVQGQAASEERTALEAKRSKKLDDQLDWLRDRAQGKTVAVSKPEQLQLEFALPWLPEVLRASPNEMCRMALFTAQRGPRRQYLDEAVFIAGEGEATYTGTELRAENDELVWLQCLFLAGGQNLTKDNWITFTPSQMCQAIGWTPSGPNYKLLRECLLRLKATALVLQTRNVNDGRALSLIGDFKWKTPEGRPDKIYAVEIPLKIAQWFGANNFTRLNWHTYRKLSQIARRLYDWGASHKNPFAIRIETVYKLCGSKAASIENFKKILLRAIKELNETGVFKKVWLDKRGLLHIERHDDPSNHGQLGEDRP